MRWNKKQPISKAELIISTRLIIPDKEAHFVYTASKKR